MRMNAYIIACIIQITQISSVWGNAIIITLRKQCDKQQTMALMNLLPDLNKAFCNFELGLDAEHVCVTAVNECQQKLLQLSMPSDTECEADIKTQFQSESATLPPTIECSVSSTNKDTNHDVSPTAPLSVPTPSPTNDMNL